MWNRVRLQKLIVPKLVKKFPAFYGTQLCLAVFGSPTWACYDSGLSSSRFSILFPYNIHCNASCYARIYFCIAQVFYFFQFSTLNLACIFFFAT